MKILRSSKEISISQDEFLNIVGSYKDIVIDLGTGQGAFPYFEAKDNKEKFYIGLDSCMDSMTKYSVKKYKNKVNNLMYVIMNVQNLDEVFNNLFKEVYINLPWGTLLEGLFKEELYILDNISRICKSFCSINICFSYEDKFEECEIKKRSLPKLDDNYFDHIFKPMYEKYGFNIVSIDYLDKENLYFRSKWMYTLSRGRKFYNIVLEKRV